MDFSKRYVRKDFQKFLEKFLTDKFEKQFLEIPLSNYFETDNRYIKQAFIIGKDKDLNLPVYEFIHDSENDPRVSLTKEAFRIMKRQFVEKALAVFVSLNSDDYRFSYLSVDYTFGEGGKVITKVSNPKRYSFLLGPNAKLHTAESQLNRKVVSLEDLEERFSIEVVNKEFYKGIHDLFYKFVENIKLPEENEELKKNFVIRFFSRIIFLWFLKKKKSKNDVPLIPDEILSSKVVKNDYYHNILEPLFYEVLNTPVNTRNINFKPHLYEFIRYFDKIPFLNGGLFTPKYHDYYELDENGYSKYRDTLIIPDELIKEFFEHLELYNFTVDENTPVDVDLSIDPEMLGLILENLLAELNPETGRTARHELGSFYTPKEIVDFMVTQSLKYYLLENTNLSEDKINYVLSERIDDENGVDLTEEDKRKISETLYSIRILDPACGSGAFPVGMLLKISHVLSYIDPDAKVYEEFILSKLPSSFQREIKRVLEEESLQYLRKLYLIENAIYGVDIQEVAVELSRLRIFLSLVIESSVDDEKENRGVKPLPNLDFKFLAADTLIKLPEEKVLFSLGPILKLKNIIKLYFSAQSLKEKQKLREEYKKIKEEAKNLYDQWYGASEEKDFDYYISKWDPFSDEPAEFFDPFWMFGIEDGFDIVIGNPPYIQLQNNRGELAKKYKNEGYEVFDRTGDIYCLFYERGVQLLKPNGFLCYITSNKWMRAGYGEKLRQFFKKLNPILLIDLGPGVFKSATVDTSVILLQNKEKTNKTVGIELKGKATKNLAEYLKENPEEVYMSKNVWFIGDSIEFKIKEKIENIGKPLKEWDLRIYRGILTGLNKAFIIDTETRNMILDNCNSDDEKKRTEELIKPVLRGRDIYRYCYEWKDLWLINIPAGFTNSNRNNLSPEDFMNKNYKALFEYLKCFEDKAKKRYDKGDYWWELRNCDYLNEFEKEKIVWQELSKGSNFAYDDCGYYILNTGYIMVGNDLKFVLGVINSKLIEYFFRRWLTVNLGKKGIRWLHQYVINLPVVNLSNINGLFIEKINTLVNIIIKQKQDNIISKRLKLEKEIDLLVYQLYELTPKEIKYIEKEVSRK
ncbi:MAG: Eco57I restriction-modification methylase domain-containing protein [Thermosipho sp. (in: Bacteria)]|nr:Eco57I restriction-modification methylase domain-containing protein [Thermosipho sp. (in: thermotogales)]